MSDSDKQRDTRQRRMIYEAVMKHRDHPDADRIYLDVLKTDKKISKATVYRNLRILSENGLIMQVKMPGADRYDSTNEKHYHIRCVICGTVVDAPVGYEAENDSIVESQTGFRINRHRTVFEGICPECQAQFSDSEDRTSIPESDRE